MRKHLIYLIVGVFLGVYLVNGEKMVKRSFSYSGITRNASDRVNGTRKKTPPGAVVSNSANRSRTSPSTSANRPAASPSNSANRPATSPSNSANQSATSLSNSLCPDPFLPDLSPSLKRPTCFNKCCLPCPYVNNLYPRNTIDTIYTILSVLRIFSFVCVSIILLSYLVLPNKREHQATTVLCLNTSLLVFLAVTFFYIGDHRKLQCADEYTQANMMNNPLCGVQGIILIFTTFASILYCFLLIVQLHLQTVWQSGIIQRNYVIAQCLVLFISTMFTIIPAATHQVSFEFGAVCLVPMNMINQYFWFPLAIIVLPGFFIHLGTFAYIAKSQCFLNDDFDFDDTICESTTTTTTNQSITKITGMEVINSIKVQWRALVLSMVFLDTFIIYWAYIYVVKVSLSPLLNPSEASSWINDWISCVLTIDTTSPSTNAQDYCYSAVSKHHVPSIALIWAAESLTAILGISIFAVFGTRTNLWCEWRAWFQNRYGRVENQ